MNPNAPREYKILVGEVEEYRSERDKLDKIVRSQYAEITQLRKLLYLYHGHDVFTDSRGIWHCKECHIDYRYDTLRNIECKLRQLKEGSNEN